jgi:hypothetical protein
MVSLLPHRKKDEGPTYKQQVHDGKVAEILAEEHRSIDAELLAAGGVSFEYQMIEDETIRDMLDPTKPTFIPILEPMKWFLARLPFLSNCGEREASSFKLKADIQIAMLKNMTDNPVDYLHLNGCRAYIHMRINDSIGGFKIKTLTETKRRIEIAEETVKKPGFLKRHGM